MIIWKENVSAWRSNNAAFKRDQTSKGRSIKGPHCADPRQLHTAQTPFDERPALRCEQLGFMPQIWRGNLSAWAEGVLPLGRTLEWKLRIDGVVSSRRKYKRKS